MIRPKQFFHDLDGQNKHQLVGWRDQNVTNAEMSSLALTLNGSHKGLRIFNTDRSEPMFWDGVQFQASSGTFQDGSLTITASEDLLGGDLVNVFSNGGIANVRKASGAIKGLEANGFVLDPVEAGASASVFTKGVNNRCSEMVPGRQFLSTTQPGKTTSVVPSGAGRVSQIVGFASSSTSLNFQSELPVVLA